MLVYKKGQPFGCLKQANECVSIRILLNGCPLLYSETCIIYIYKKRLLTLDSFIKPNTPAKHKRLPAFPRVEP